jgi:hypothetical protein
VCSSATVERVSIVAYSVFVTLAFSWTDEFGRTIAIGYSSDTTAGVTNVAWFKLLGNGHGHGATTGGSASASTSKGSKLAIHDTDVIVSGTYTGHHTAASVHSPGLQFPGVHSLFQV